MQKHTLGDKVESTHGINTRINVNKLGDTLSASVIRRAAQISTGFIQHDIGILAALVSYTLASDGNDVRCRIDLGAGFGNVTVDRNVAVLDFFLCGAS